MQFRLRNSQRYLLNANPDANHSTVSLRPVGPAAKKTLRPNSIVAIITEATGIFFRKKKQLICTQQNAAEKCNILAFFINKKYA